MLRLLGGVVEGVRESGMGRNGDQRRFPEGHPGFYTDGWVRSMVHRRGSPLVVVGGRVGRHGELIPGSKQKVSVADTSQTYL
jgi:hypothetical protein